MDGWVSGQRPRITCAPPSGPARPDPTRPAYIAGANERAGAARGWPMLRRRLLVRASWNRGPGRSRRPPWQPRRGPAPAARPGVLGPEPPPGRAARTAPRARADCTHTLHTGDAHALLTQVRTQTTHTYGSHAHELHRCRRTG